jgi:hypothetical protein
MSEKLCARCGGVIMPITPPDTQGAGYGELLADLETCASQSEMGRNFAKTPPSCRAAMAAIQTLTAENERLEAKLARTAAGIATMLPKNMSLDNPRWPDSTTVPLDTTLGELRALRALRSLLTELSEPKS